MNGCLRKMAVSGLLLVVSWSHAQAPAPPTPEPRNIVQLSASATVQVPQDWLMLTLSTSRDGLDASVVQAQLKQALDEALALARSKAQDGQLEVRTGDFRLSPRYSREGSITGWQGYAELVLEGRDFVRIAALAGKIPSLTMGGVQFSLSRETQERVEAETQATAINRFKDRAGAIAKAFGFATFTLREVSVNGNDNGPAPRPRVMAMQARSAAADAPVPLEAGKSDVVVTVSGAVQLR